MRWSVRKPVDAGRVLPQPDPREADPGEHDRSSGSEHPTERIARPASPSPDTMRTEVLSRAVTGPVGTESADLPRPREATAPTAPQPAAAPVPAGAVLSGAGPGHNTQVLDPAVAGAAADPFRDTTMLVRPQMGPQTGEEHQPPAPLMSRERAAEVGIYSGAAVMLVAVVGIAARLWAQWDGVERLMTTGLAAASLILGALWLRAPWGRSASPACTRGVSVMLATGVLAGGVGTALLFGLGQSSDPVAGLSHALASVAVMVAVNAVARTPYSETALLGALTWLGWVGLPDGLSLWLGLLGLGVAWVGLGVRFARGPRTAAVAGAGLALASAAVMAAQPGAWVARGVLAVLACLGLWGFLTGRPNYWLALGAAGAGALASGVAMDVLSPAPALLAGGFAITAVSAVAMRWAAGRAGDSDRLDSSDVGS